MLNIEVAACPPVTYPATPVLIAAKDVTYRTSYTIGGIYSLESNGLFPRRIRISQTRIAWREADVVAWMQYAVDARQASTTNAAPIVVLSTDRFLDRHQVKELVLLSDDTFTRRERTGNFPGRIVIGPGRVAWLEREVHEWIAAAAGPPPQTTA